MSFKRKILISVFALLSLGLLAGGDCEFEIDGFPRWGGYFYDPYPVVIYEDPYFYDPFYPCCF